MTKEEKCYDRTILTNSARIQPFAGEMAEWSNAPDSKSGIRLYRIVGSNPTLSAILS